MKKLILSLLLLATGSSVFSQNKFEIDLKTISNDEITVDFHLKNNPSNNELRFSFPATVPGTYATQDYGRFITSLKAVNTEGKKLTVKKEGNNTYVISGARNLKTISYTVEDIIDKKVKKDPIFQPAATNFEAGKNYLFNNGGIFGFIEGEEHLPIDITIKKPEHLYGATSLPEISSSAQEQNFRARNYHQLIDCPMMFSKPDTAQFWVNKTKVTISVFDVNGTPRARHFYQALKRDMEAIAGFLPALPVEHYTFIIYVDDLKEVGQALTGKMGLFKKIKLAMKFKSLGLGALEHGNSSTYYLADFGNALDIPELNLDGQLTSAAIHEFMHILTPLGLHSQHIGNFNYTKPVMSKHLWLYEGITEYFAHLVKFKGGVYTPDEFLDQMEMKFSSGASFPVHEMSFTEMSEHVLEEKYHKHYGQVYQRGAALGMLLDAEIQRITNGKKALIDIMLTLNKRYGAEKSFDEDRFFDEFVAEVDPALKSFFDRYIEGKNQWQPNDQLTGMNIVYYDSLQEKGVLSPVSENENDIKTALISGGLKMVITKVGPAEWAGLQKGDEIDLIAFRDAYKKNGKNPDEGSVVEIEIKRKGKIIKHPVTVKYGLKTYRHVLKWK